MRTTLRHTATIAILALAALAIGRADAAAQRGTDPGRERPAYDRGYQDGRAQGDRDARATRPFAFEHYREYQRADLGYNRSFGDIELYRRVYRQGYGQGYREGFGRYGRAVPAPRYGSGYGYGSGPAYGGAYRSDFAYQVGYADGVEKGFEDARKRRSFDALRHRWYRDGDHRYRREYGPREFYKRTYRDGFLAGYDRGYREAPRYGYRVPRGGFGFGFGFSWRF